VEAGPFRRFPCQIIRRGIIDTVARRTGYWKTHPNKELQKLLLWCDELGWTIKDPTRYYKVLCTCGDHQETVHISPSTPTYLRNKRKQIERTLPICAERKRKRNQEGRR
jgi:hypothetical protein